MGYAPRRLGVPSTSPLKGQSPTTRGALVLGKIRPAGCARRTQAPDDTLVNNLNSITGIIYHPWSAMRRMSEAGRASSAPARSSAGAPTSFARALHMLCPIRSSSPSRNLRVRGLSAEKDPSWSVRAPRSPLLQSSRTAYVAARSSHFQSKAVRLDYAVHSPRTQADL